MTLLSDLLAATQQAALLAQQVANATTQVPTTAAGQLAPSGDRSGARDTAALMAAAGSINAAGRGRIELVPGATYTVCQQVLAKALGRGYAYQAAPVLTLSGCKGRVTIDLADADLRTATGMRFGAFDPVTGKSVGNGGVNPDYRAEPGSMIELTGNADVTVRNGELDGNMDGYEVGGEWNGPGRQVWACGVKAYGNRRLHLENLSSHHHGLDGVIIGWDGLSKSSPTYPHTLVNVVCDSNGRQGLSWVGGNHLYAFKSQFNRSGKGRIYSPPGAGADLEAESSICRNGQFAWCDFIDNAGCGIAATSGDVANVAFDHCNLVGRTNFAALPNKPGFAFRDCEFTGTVANAAMRTLFQRCKFNPGFVSTGLLSMAAADGSVFEDCEFYLVTSGLGECRRTIHRRSKIFLRGGVAPGGQLMVAFDCVFEDSQFIDQTTDPAAQPVYIALSSPTGATWRGRNTFSPRIRVYQPSAPAVAVLP